MLDAFDKAGKLFLNQADREPHHRLEQLQIDVMMDPENEETCDCVMKLKPHWRQKMTMKLPQIGQIKLNY